MPGLAKREADQHCECVGAPPRESGGGTLCLNGAAAHAARRRRAAVCVCGASWPAPCRLMTSGGTELLEVVQVYGVGQDLLKAQGPLALQTLLGDGRRHPAGRRRHDARVARQLLAVLAGGAATNTATLLQSVVCWVVCTSVARNCLAAPHGSEASFVKKSKS